MGAWASCPPNIFLHKGGLRVLSHMATFQHAGIQPQCPQPFADLKAVGAGLQQEDVLGAKLPSCPFQQGLQAEVLAAGDFLRVVMGLPHEDRCGEGVRVAVQPDDFPFGRGTGSQVGLHRSFFLGTWFVRVFQDIFFVMVFLRWPG